MKSAFPGCGSVISRTNNHFGDLVVIHYNVYERCDENIREEDSYRYRQKE